MDGPSDIEARYKALVERISRYPVSDPAARARMLAEVEAIYRREWTDGSRSVRAGEGALDEPQ